MLILVMPAVIAFIVTFMAVPAVIRLAEKHGCYDMPGKRRFHRQKTPRGGGIGFFIGVMISLLVSLAWDRTLVAYFGGAFLLLCVGMIDDKKALGWKIKMAAVFAAVSIVVFAGDVSIHQIGVFGRKGMVDLGTFSVPFTYLGIVGVTNALNLIDGLNGLAGGVSLLGFFFLGIAALSSGNLMVATASFAFAGALAGFLFYNFPKARIFMGDAGSMFIGFSLSVFSILLTQDARHPVEPMFPTLVLLLPIFDTLRVMVLRILRKENPFKADKSHIHHLLVRRGLSAVTAVVLLWVITAACGAAALVLMHKSSGMLLAAVLSGLIVQSLLAEALVLRLRRRGHLQLRFPIILGRRFRFAWPRS